jgi:dsDNA-specific endonuclease/ATPase MutS2
MKSRLSKVLDKMPKDKIELAKVELGLADDIKQAVKEMKTISEKMKTNADKAENLFQRVNAENKKLQQKAENIKKDGTKKYFKAEKAFKELGIDMPSEFEKLVNDLYDTDISSYISNNKNVFPK